MLDTGQRTVNTCPAREDSLNLRIPDGSRGHISGPVRRSGAEVTRRTRPCTLTSVPRFPNDTKTATLAALPLFEALSRKELEQLAMMTDDLEFPAGKVLCRQGDLGSEFLVIIEGEAEVTKDGAPVATLGPGDYFGEIALVEDVRRTATVTAATSLRFFILTRQAFRSLLRRNPKVEAQILDVIAARVARTERDG